MDAYSKSDELTSVNVVVPDSIETEMLDPFTGTEERKAGLPATVPLKRIGRPEEIHPVHRFPRAMHFLLDTAATSLLNLKSPGS